MSEKNTGGPAFPIPGMTGLPNGEFVYGENGMTLRDYFAAKVIQALSTEYSPTYAAHQAYLYADAMLEARLK